jgi:L,D-transpeptidase YcbB
MRRCLFFLVLIMSLLGANRCGRRQSSEETRLLQARLESKRVPEFVTEGRRGAHFWKLLQDFYVRRQYRLSWAKRSWLGREFPHPQLGPFLRAVQEADREGLDPADYDADSIAARCDEVFRNVSRRNPLDPAKVVDLDLWLTYTFLTYSSHLAIGRFDPKTIDAQWQTSPRKVGLVEMLEGALEQNRMGEVLKQLEPPYPEYRALKESLARYRAIAAKGGWSQLPEDTVLREGDHNRWVPALRNNLAIIGDISQTDRVVGQNGDNTLFDEVLARGVRKFEARHGLKDDGVADPQMIVALNLPVERRIRQIELNLERLRWLPDQLGTRHIRVYIPDYRLYVMENDKILLTMRVIVGRREDPTPIFSDEMTYLVFSPHWYIPESIAIKETLPRVLNDPGYLERQKIEVVRKGSRRGEEALDPKTIDWSKAAERPENFPYTFRQQPGPGNALGIVKFMFPNQFNVYLHDTPTDNLFDRRERDFSHGCVRVERPVELAHYVLSDQPEWTPEKISAAMHAGEEKVVPLKEPLPVHLLYWTAWVDKEGALQFRQDIYEHDQSQDELLTKLSRLRRSTKLGK